jgi:hypothetical protein
VFKLISPFIGQNPKILFYACVEEGCSAPLAIAREKQTCEKSIPFKVVPS